MTFIFQSYLTKEKELTILQGVTGNRFLEQTILLSLSSTFRELSLSPCLIGENSGRSLHRLGRTIEDMAGLSSSWSPGCQCSVVVGRLWMMAGE